jgi:ATP-dependent Lon protease
MSSVDHNTKTGKKYNLRKRSRKGENEELSKKVGESSDDDEWVTSDEEVEDSVESGEFNDAEFKKFLGKMFPSKHLAERIKEMDEIDRKMDATEAKKKKHSKSKKTPKKQKRPVKKVEESEEEEDDSEDEEEYEFDEDDEDMDLAQLMKGGKQKFNIVFTIGDPFQGEYYDEDEDEDEDYTLEGDEDFESEEESEVEDEPLPPIPKKKSRRSKKKGSTKEEDESEVAPVKKKKKRSSLTEEDDSVIEQLLKLTKGKEDEGLISELHSLIEEKRADAKKHEEKLKKKQKGKNLTKFKSLLREKNVTNDFAFFAKLELEKQDQIISEVQEINKLIRVEKPYRLQLLESDIPTKFKACAIKKVSALRYMEPGGGEYYKVKNWVDTFMNIPFGKYTSLPLSIEDGVEKTGQFMAAAKKTLDDAVYGLDDAKLQIMQLVGQWITNPNAVGTAIAIKGPPGTGKTTLIKEGISKILNRNFEFIALGGATDSSFLEGHSYTYEGSQWGKIVDILIKSRCMNPVIYFDELDKISETPKGEEIAGILTHLTDTSQNSQFHDKYFSEVDFDLSKCLFIFSYNDESRVNPILKDRMYRIQTDGYDNKQKVVIANNYLLPKIREQVKFNKEDIVLSDDVVSYIISSFTDGEKGVRNLKRCLEIIHTKLNLYRLMTPETNLFEKEQTLKVSFPFEVTREVVDKLIKKGEENPILASLYM